MVCVREVLSLYSVFLHIFGYLFWLNLARQFVMFIVISTKLVFELIMFFMLTYQQLTETTVCL